MDYSITVNGQEITIPENEFDDVMKRMFALARRHEVERLLDEKDIEATGKQIDTIADGLYDSVIYDEIYWETEDRSILCLAEEQGLVENAEDYF